MTSITLPKTSPAAEDVQAFDYSRFQMEETHPALLAMYDVDRSSAKERPDVTKNYYLRLLWEQVADRHLRDLHLVYNDRALFTHHIYTGRWGRSATLLSHEEHGTSAA